MMSEDRSDAPGIARNWTTPAVDDVDFPLRSVSRLPRLVTKRLKRWFSAHSAHPYPTKQEKRALQEQTNLSELQVSNWFANARRRYSAASSNEHPTHLPQSISVPNLANTTRWQNLNPLERWRHSPPDQEPAPLEAIVTAVHESLDHNGSESNGIQEHHTATWRPSHAYSINSFETLSALGTSQSSTSTDSTFSFVSNGSTLNLQHSSPLHLRKRRRRRPKKFPSELRQPPSTGKPRKYECTFCTDTFTSKYDWTRHERALHLLLEKWTCCPQGPIYFDRVPRCSFCEAETPTPTHIESHRYTECATKPAPLRTFGRKDHLSQHLRLFHQVDQMPDQMAYWKTRIIAINCRCGFCGERFVDWSARNDHIAEHFRDGATMKDWTGCRGLDPEVALLVENAMPPYLIGYERAEFEPFSAARHKGRVTSAGRQHHQLPTAFESLTARLGEFVLQAMKTGVVVTDDTVRKQARLIMYGDDDAWNQTPADNVEWLRLFKEGVRLKSAGCPTWSGSNPYPTAPSCAPASVQTLLPECTNTVLPQDDVSSALAGANLDFDLLSPYSTGDLTNLPLCWQTPECLAEFSQLSSRQAGSATINACADGIGNGTPTFAEASVLPARDTEALKPFMDETNCPRQQQLSSENNVAVSWEVSPWTNTHELVFPFDLNLS